MANIKTNVNLKIIVFKGKNMQPICKYIINNNFNSFSKHAVHIKYLFLLSQENIVKPSALLICLGI